MSGNEEIQKLMAEQSATLVKMKDIENKIAEIKRNLTIANEAIFTAHKNVTKDAKVVIAAASEKILLGNKKVEELTKHLGNLRRLDGGLRAELMVAGDPDMTLEGGDEISKLRKAVRDFESDGVPDKIEWHKKEIADISDKINLLKAHIKLMENQNSPDEVKILTKQLESLNRLKDGHHLKLELFAAEPPSIPPKPTKESIEKFQESQKSGIPPSPVTPSASASKENLIKAAGALSGALEQAINAIKETAPSVSPRSSSPAAGAPAANKP